VDASFLFPLLLFFLPIAEEGKGGINGDRIKLNTSSQLLLALALLCKIRISNNAV